MANCGEYENFIFGMLIEISFPEDAFLHFISVQFKNSCSSDGQSSQNFEDFSFNQSWIASVIGVGDEISYLKVGIQKDWKLRTDSLSFLLFQENHSEKYFSKAVSSAMATNHDSSPNLNLFVHIRNFV